MSAATEAYAPRVCALQKATPMRSPCATTLLAATKESQCAAMKTNNNNNNNNNKNMPAKSGDGSNLSK